jgi:hypothetical protein
MKKHLLILLLLALTFSLSLTHSPLTFATCLEHWDRTGPYAVYDKKGNIRDTKITIYKHTPHDFFKEWKDPLTLTTFALLPLAITAIPLFIHLEAWPIYEDSLTYKHQTEVKRLFMYPYRDHLESIKLKSNGQPLFHGDEKDVRRESIKAMDKLYAMLLKEAKTSPSLIQIPSKESIEAALKAANEKENSRYCMMLGRAPRVVIYPNLAFYRDEILSGRIFKK